MIRRLGGLSFLYESAQPAARMVGDRLFAHAAIILARESTSSGLPHRPPKRNTVGRCLAEIPRSGIQRSCSWHAARSARFERRVVVGRPLASPADAFPRTQKYFFFGGPSPFFSKPVRARKKPRLEAAREPIPSQPSCGISMSRRNYRHIFLTYVSIVSGCRERMTPTLSSCWGRKQLLRLLPGSGSGWRCGRRSARVR